MSSSEVVVLGQQVELDPRVLLVDLNVRHAIRLDKAFVKSIKELGVLVPIVAVRTASGDVRVRMGHRRTLAAIEAGREVVPVIVVADEATDTAGEIERVLQQWAENAYRTGFTMAEEVGVVEQLAMLGVSATKIAKGTGMQKRVVEAALAVSKSDLAKAAAQRYDFLTLGQAAAVAEFEQDSEAVKTLVAAAKTGRFDHVVQQLRDSRTHKEAYEHAAKVLSDAGIMRIDRPYRFDAETVELSQLLIDGKAADVETHATCPGHAAWLDDEWTHPDGDEATDDDDGWELTCLPVYVCTQPSEHGSTGHQVSDQRVTEAVKTDLAKAAAKKDERRQVLANNKAWRSAEAVRRDWLRVFSARKTMPAGGLRFMLGEFVAGDHVIRDAMQSGHQFGADLLGISVARNGWSIDRQGVHDSLSAASDSRAQMICLSLMLGAIESSLDVFTWRRRPGVARRYLESLSGWGYELSEVEQLVVVAADDTSEVYPKEDAEG